MCEYLHLSALLVRGRVRLPPHHEEVAVVVCPKKMLVVAHHLGWGREVGERGGGERWGREVRERLGPITLGWK